MHGRSEDDVKKLLVDSWKFRKLEEYHVLKVTEIIDDDPEAVYGMTPFRNYIADAAKKGLLPPTWTKDNTNACIEYSLNENNWSNLHNLWVEGLAYINHYGGPSMLVHLTLFAYQVVGSVEGDDEQYERRLELEVKYELRQ